MSRRFPLTRPKPRRRVLLRPWLWLLGLVVAAWLAGLVWFAAEAGREWPSAVEETDAIVVLTGGSERLIGGLALLEAGMARKLFVSGVYRGVEVAELLHIARRSPGDLECCIVLGYAADDTAGNARETAAWMTAEGFGSLRLVTANYHMPRSLLEFRHAMPSVAIVPHPVAPDSVHVAEWWRWPGTASLLATEYVKYLAACLRTVLEPRGQADGAAA